MAKWSHDIATVDTAVDFHLTQGKWTVTQSLVLLFRPCSDRIDAHVMRGLHCGLTPMEIPTPPCGFGVALSIEPWTLFFFFSKSRPYITISSCSTQTFCPAVLRGLGLLARSSGPGHVVVSGFQLWLWGLRHVVIFLLRWPHEFRPLASP